MDSGVFTRLFELDSPDNMFLLVGSNYELILNLGAFQQIRDPGGSIRQVIDEWLADEPAQTSESESENSDEQGEIQIVIAPMVPEELLQDDAQAVYQTVDVELCQEKLRKHNTKQDALTELLTGMMKLLYYTMNYPLDYQEVEPGTGANRSLWL